MPLARHQDRMEGGAQVPMSSGQNCACEAFVWSLSHAAQMPALIHANNPSWRLKTSKIYGTIAYVQIQAHWMNSHPPPAEVMKKSPGAVMP